MDIIKVVQLVSVQLKKAANIRWKGFIENHLLEDSVVTCETIFKKKKILKLQHFKIHYIFIW